MGPTGNVSVDAVCLCFPPGTSHVCMHIKTSIHHQSRLVSCTQVCISDHYGLMTTLRVCEPGTAGDDAPAARVTHEDHGRRPDTP